MSDNLPLKIVGGEIFLQAESTRGERKKLLLIMLGYVKGGRIARTSRQIERKFFVKKICAHSNLLEVIRERLEEKKLRETDLVPLQSVPHRPPLDKKLDLYCECR